LPRVKFSTDSREAFSKPTPRDGKTGMSTVTTPDVPRGSAPLDTGLRRYRIDLERYQRMVESGVFGDKSPVFLWKGELVEKVADMTKGRAHVFTLNRLARILPGRIPGGYFVEQDQPIDLGGDSVPEPDIKVVRGSDAGFLDRTPEARDVPLIAEVADSSLEDDTGVMLRAYAAALVPVYWVVNLPSRRLEVYSRPAREPFGGMPVYLDCQYYELGDEVPVILDGLEVGRIAVREMLP